MINEKTWQLLKDAIYQNRVIPIIGDEFFYAEIDGQRIPYVQYITKELTKKFPIPDVYKDIINDKITLDFNMIADAIRVSNIINSQMYGFLEKSTNIYYEINTIVENTPIICDEKLIEFLNRIHFPIILTTSFIPGIEDALKNKIDNIHAKSYDKSLRVDIHDNENNLVYYLFGKCNKLNKGYMVTEDDLLDYMHYWHNIESRPKELCKLLSSKFLLVLGCDYPNWLFRFFWHSIKNFNLINGNEEVRGIVAGNIIETDYELSHFLSRIQTRAFGNSNIVLDELLNICIESYQEENSSTNISKITSDKPDVFISYAHEDAEIATEIAHTFEKFGAKVWFDSSSLVGSDLYDDIIYRKIQECERFIPILSSYTESAKRGYFRKEWSLSIEENKYRLGSPYICPIIIDGTPKSSPRFPKEFKEAHILNFLDADFNNAIKKLIRSFRE